MSKPQTQNQGVAQFYKVRFKSENQLWKTPIHVYENLHKEFKFDFDPCPANADFNGLLIEWGESNFVNPPYNKLKEWAKKSYEESQKGKTVVMLIPSRTDTRYWHDYIMKADEIRFIKGRIQFQGAKNNAPFASSIVIFKKEALKAADGEGVK